MAKIERELDPRNKISFKEIPFEFFYHLKGNLYQVTPLFKKIRLSKSLRIEDVSLATGVSKSHIQDIEANGSIVKFPFAFVLEAFLKEGKSLYGPLRFFEEEDRKYRATEEIKSLRTKSGLRQSDIAEVCGISAPTFSSIESRTPGLRTYFPTAYLIESILKEF